MTRKRTENVFNFNRKTEEDEAEAAGFEALKSELNESYSEEMRPRRDEYKIEFNLKNKIELVPKNDAERDNERSGSGKSSFS
jgi:hypothetical protein